MKLVTGSNGFIGKNLLAAIQGAVPYDREHGLDYLRTVLKKADVIYHLGASVKDGYKENLELLRFILDNVSGTPAIVLASSVQTTKMSEYGKNRLDMEKMLEDYERAYIYRLPNIFGRWCRPNYNNVVATFCYGQKYGLGMTIDDPEAKVQLVYIDDLVKEFIAAPDKKPGRHAVQPMYQVTVGELAEIIKTFRHDPQFVSRLYKTFQQI